MYQNQRENYQLVRIAHPTRTPQLGISDSGLESCGFFLVLFGVDFDYKTTCGTEVPVPWFWKLRRK
ncbi:hypothetical protein ACR30L_10770 [Psychromonas sp. PT13]|uniref:hypothetical protein n=1 Tax=Psychromonas sp. PT13 TaxID=3439547 RepID=UPI003EC139C7